jgi:hypothetical protein
MFFPFLFFLTTLFSTPSPSPQFDDWKAGTVVSATAVEQYGVDRCFTATAIPDNVFARMKGHSYPAGCEVPRANLRYVKVLHYDFNDKIRQGELVCNKAIASDLVKIFRQLYDQRYPIESIRLIDDFDANDEKSMRANNTSCFCYRKVKGQRKLSKHALGRAVDINPLYNPCVRYIRGRRTIQPSTATRYANRKASFNHKITRQDAAYKLFISHGFRWGGAWRTVKDYQHFEK